MYGSRHKEPVLPKRTVWADKTRSVLADLYKRKAELVKQLDDEIRATKSLCNHTLSDGVSTMENVYDYENDETCTRCSVCQVV